MNNQFKTKLRNWRGDRTVKEVAPLLGIDLRTYYYFEAGDRVPKKTPCLKCLEKMIEPNPKLTTENT